jgi:predicted nucleotidyltransferase
MAVTVDKQLIYEKIRQYADRLAANNIKVWRMYLFGSYAKGTFDADSDIDLAVFWIEMT